jgi:hypothetical protein
VDSFFALFSRKMTDHSQFGQSLFGLTPPPPPLLLSTSTTVTSGSKQVPIRFPIPGASRHALESGPTTFVRNTLPSSSSSSSDSLSLFADVELRDSSKHGISWTNLFGTSLSTSGVNSDDVKRVDGKDAIREESFPTVSPISLQILLNGGPIIAPGLDVDMNFNEVIDDTDTHAHLEFPPESTVSAAESSIDVSPSAPLSDLNEYSSIPITNMNGRKRKREVGGVTLLKKSTSDGSSSKQSIPDKGEKKGQKGGSDLGIKKTNSPTSSSSSSLLSPKKKTKKSVTTQNRVDSRFDQTPIATAVTTSEVIAVPTGEKTKSKSIGALISSKPITATKKKKKIATAASTTQSLASSSDQVTETLAASTSIQNVINTKPIALASSLQTNEVNFSSSATIQELFQESTSKERILEPRSKELILEPRSETLRVLLQHIYDPEENAACLRFPITSNPSVGSSVFHQARIKWKSAMDLFLSELRKPQDHKCSLLVLLLHLHGILSESQSLNDCVVIAVRCGKDTVPTDDSEKADESSLNLAIVRKNVLKDFGIDEGKSDIIEIGLPFELSVGFFGSNDSLWPENVKRLEVDCKSCALLRAHVINDADLNGIIRTVAQSPQSYVGLIVVPYDFFPLSVKSNPFLFLGKELSTSSETNTTSLDLSLNTSLQPESSLIPSSSTDSSINDTRISPDLIQTSSSSSAASVQTLRPLVQSSSSSSAIAHSLPPVSHPPPATIVVSSRNDLPLLNDASILHQSHEVDKITFPKETVHLSTSSIRRQQSSNHSHPIMLTITEAETIASRAAACSALSVHTEHIQVTLLSAAKFLADESGVRINPPDLSSLVKDVTDKALDDLKRALEKIESPSLQVPVQTTAITRRRISPELIR